jgi:hypothetical protein
MLIIGDDPAALLEWFRGSDWAATNRWRSGDTGFASVRHLPPDHTLISPALMAVAPPAFMISSPGTAVPLHPLRRELLPPVPSRAAPSLPGNVAGARG